MKRSFNLGEFTKSFRVFITQLLGRKTGALYNINRIHINKLNSWLNELTPDTACSGKDIADIKLCLEELFQRIHFEEIYEDRVCWFLINLSLNSFMRCHLPKTMRLFWPLLLKVFVRSEDTIVLHKLVDDALNNTPSVSWLSSRLLCIIIRDNYLLDTVRDIINTRANMVKFKQLLNLNRDFSTLMNMIELLFSLKLEPVFLPNLVFPYIRYIESVNPNFANLIQCCVKTSTHTQNSKLSGLNCYVQPIDKEVLVLWVQHNERSYCHYINLMVLDSYEILPNPNCIVKLHFACCNERKTRSSQYSMNEILKSFSLVTADGKSLSNICFELKIKDVVHYNWLISYLKSLRGRKISVDTVMQNEIIESKVVVASLKNGDIVQDKVSVKDTRENSQELSDEKPTLRLQQHYKKRTARKRRNFRYTKRKQHIKSQSFDNSVLDNWKKDNSVSRIDTNRLKKNNILPTFEDSQVIKAPKQRLSRAIDTQMLSMQEIPQSQDFRTSTPVGADFTEYPTTTTDKTSLMVEESATSKSLYSSEPINVINESLRLFSSNVLNKLKMVEFTMLQKRNELQSEVEREFKQIETKQRAKLKEIQEYCNDQLNKIL
ncbi:hypothetical protein KGF56_000617 [Candida oxycetoniae]|uniref:Uncharacterized protein n=1 Tax=Candida oxycetoniae TaxID=497107 RepID=A0AAI9T131_9ASCO|nr:uncharacterized protein KGF56_000617 [Candida oxycetoniae]KAI3406485.2 hypothetical protein KGF56_000617 [Candida oxycetoniae]